MRCLLVRVFGWYLWGIGELEGWGGGRGDGPTVWKVGAHLLQEGVTHVLDREDEAVLVGVEAFLHVGEELEG